MADVIRILVIGLSAFNLGVTFSIFFRYAQSWRRCPKRRGLKIRHVLLVTTAHGLMIAGIGIAYIESLRNGDVLAWRAWVYLAANLGTVWAMVDIGRFMRQRDREAACGVQ